MLDCVNPRPILLSSLTFLGLVLTGCRHTSTDVPPQANLERAHLLEVARTDLAQIPPPSKNLYMNIRTIEEWENPLLTVQQNMITITVLMADANPSPLGKGTMLRPVAARKEVLNIAPEHLAEALNAIPHGAWPYGRVVAIEEAHEAPKSVRPQLRRNIEAAMQTLSDIGIVADEWNDNRPVGIR